MPAPRRQLDPELASWARSTFRPARVDISPTARATAERRAIERAIENSSNLSSAAVTLGASRRTLQNRMREYGLPYGRSGRPKESLPHAGGGSALVVALGAAAVVGGFFLGRWWMKRRAERSAPLHLPAIASGRGLIGLDLLGAK